TIQWGSVPCILQNGDITGYSVRYYADGPVQTMSIFGMSLETTLPDLVSSTTYLVQVAAVNNVGTGEFSNTRSQMTLVAVPVLMVDSVTPTSVSISWTSGGSEGVSYLVEWQRDTSEDQGTVTIIDASTSYVISGLEENSRYIIRVNASNAIG
ncbi:Receptor-type tyrosine-protein phosphatase S, partial [Geodia barretti]